MHDKNSVHVRRATFQSYLNSSLLSTIWVKPWVKRSEEQFLVGVKSTVGPLTLSMLMDGNAFYRECWFWTYVVTQPVFLWGITCPLHKDLQWQQTHVTNLPMDQRNISQNEPFCNRNVHTCGTGALWDLCNRSLIRYMGIHRLGHHRFR